MHLATRRGWEMRGTKLQSVLARLGCSRCAEVVWKRMMRWTGGQSRSGEGRRVCDRSRSRDVLRRPRRGTAQGSRRSLHPPPESHSCRSSPRHAGRQCPWFDTPRASRSPSHRRSTPPRAHVMLPPRHAAHHIHRTAPPSMRSRPGGTAGARVRAQAGRRRIGTDCGRLVRCRAEVCGGMERK